MKRKGFVANSSSSSFLLVGHKVTIEDVLANPDENYMCMGKDLYEGDDVFDFTAEYAKLVKRFGWDGYTIVKCIEYQWEAGSTHVENAWVWCGRADMHNTRDVESFIDLYLDFPEEEKRVTVDTFEELDEVFIHEVMVYLDELCKSNRLLFSQVRNAIPNVMETYNGVNKEMAADLLRHWIVKGV